MSGYWMKVWFISPQEKQPQVEKKTGLAASACL